MAYSPQKPVVTTILPDLCYIYGQSDHSRDPTMHQAIRMILRDEIPEPRIIVVVPLLPCVLGIHKAGRTIKHGTDLVNLKRAPEPPNQIIQPFQIQPSERDVALLGSQHDCADGRCAGVNGRHHGVDLVYMTPLAVTKPQALVRSKGLFE